MQHEVERIKSGWLRANLVVGSITIPAMVGLILVADDFVAVVLGDQWDSAVPVLQILAWAGLLQSLQGLNGSVLRALDRTGTLLRFSIVAVIATTGAVIVGLPHGIIGVAVAYAVTSTVVEPFYTWLTTRALGASLWEAVRLYSGVAQAVALMAVCVLSRSSRSTRWGPAPSSGCRDGRRWHRSLPPSRSLARAPAPDELRLLRGRSATA